MLFFCPNVFSPHLCCISQIVLLIAIRQCAAIDLVDEAAAKLKITSKPTALDEIDRSVLKLEMERLSLKNDTDKASRDRLDRLVAELDLLKNRQKELTDQWEHEKSVMTRIQSIKEEVGL
jgi:ATP-dependent Clp protease ATP-binding subunit ClpB